MNNFWKLSTGDMPTGSAEDANSQAFSLIPNNTNALATIKSVVFSEEWKSYNFQWQIIEGPFKNRIVFQKLYCFDDKPEKRDKALQMMMRLMKLSNFTMSHQGNPTTEDLQPLCGNVLGITILEWHLEGKSGNWICALHEVDGFEQNTGESVKKTAIESAFSRNQKQSSDLLDDDVPF